MGGDVVRSSRGHRERPKRPLGRILRERDFGPYCPKCGSSQVWGFLGRLFGGAPKGCVHDECELHYLRPKTDRLTGIAAEVARTEGSELPK